LLTMTVMAPLALLQALYDGLVAMAVDDRTRRSLFAQMCFLSQSGLNWMDEWQERVAFPACSDQHSYDTLRSSLMAFAADTLGVRAVVVLDEVHQLLGKCRGFFLHRADVNDSNKLDELNSQWYSRPQLFTDTFYLLRSVLVDFVGEQPVPFATIMTSTQFRTWIPLETDNSPFSRGLLSKERIVTNAFSEQDVRRLVDRHFNLPSGFWESGDVKLHLERFAGRPLFAVNFLLGGLMESLFNRKHLPQNLRLWFVGVSDSAWNRSLLPFAREKVELARSNNYSIEGWNQYRVLDFCQFALRMCNGRITASDDLIFEAVSEGIFCLLLPDAQRANSQVAKIAEVCFRAILMEESKADSVGSDDPILKMVSSFWVQQQTVQGRDVSSWRLFERATARVLMIVLPAELNCFPEKCGTTEELECETVSAEREVPMLLQSRPGVLRMPTKQAGPDLWYSHAEHLVGVQCKCESTRCSFSEFEKLLKSIDPWFMYGVRNTPSTQISQTQRSWYAEVERNKHRFARYTRVVANVAGYDDRVYHAVTEYNAVMPHARIVLLSGSHVKASSEPLWDAISKQMGISSPAETWEHDILDQEYLELSSSAASRMKVAAVKSLCDARGIPFSVPVGPHKRKRRTKHELVEEVRAHCENGCSDLSSLYFSLPRRQTSHTWKRVPYKGN
jgi:hypothetical protein